MNIDAVEKWIKQYRASQRNELEQEKAKCDFCQSEYYGNDFFCNGCNLTIPKLVRLGLPEAIEYWSFYHQIDMSSDSLKTITKYYIPPESDIILDYLRAKLKERLSQ